MRTLLSLTVCLLLMLPALAGEPAPDEADAREAAAIGRALLSTDPSVRAAAVERLEARIARGGDLAAFLQAMGEATRSWADRHERLMEVWLQQAVHGTPTERRRAVRLLVALGEKAVERLAAELRHARLHPPAGASQDEPQADAAPQQGAEPDEHEAPAGVPRVYDMRDVLAQGMNALEVRSLLQKAADAVEVKAFKTQFVVTASDAGHAALRARLQELRTGWRRQAEAKMRTTPDEPATAKAPAAPQAPPPPAADDAPPSPGMGAAPQPGPPAPAGASRVEDAEPPDATGSEAAWKLTRLLFHLPPAAVDWQAMPKNGKPLPIDLRVDGVQVATGRAAAMGSWVQTLRRAPDARAGLPLAGADVLAAGTPLSLFSGRRIEYGKSLARTRGGAWTVVMDSVPHGIALDVQADAGDGHVDLRITATRTEVGLPLPVVRMKPSPQAAPVDLERPEWSTTRARARARLPLEGGSVLLSLGTLGGGSGEHVVVVLTLVRE